MKKLYKVLITIGMLLFIFIAYISYQSYQAVTFVNNGLSWLWVNDPMIRYDTTAIQSARAKNSKQLVYRRVYLDQQLAVSLNTTNNHYFSFTFVKSMQCNESTPYQATVTVNDESPNSVNFSCLSPDAAIFRIAEPKFHQLQVTGKDLHFELKRDEWDFNGLKKDDYMQLHYQFFRKHSSETVYPWDRD